MSVLAGLYGLLKSSPGISAVVQARIYPILLPENPSPPMLPAITYQVVGGSSQPTFDTSGMQKMRIQFDFHGTTYASADAARDALRTFLNGYRGMLSDGTFLQNAELIQTIDFYDYEPRQFRCMVEFYLYFNFQ